MRTSWRCFRAPQRSSGMPAATAICGRRRPAAGRGFDARALLIETLEGKADLAAAGGAEEDT